MNRLISSSMRYANIFIIVTVIITAFLGYHVSKIEFDPDYYSIFPDENVRMERLKEEAGIDDDLNMFFLVSVHTEEELTVPAINVLYNIIKELEKHDEIVDCVSPFNFITFRNRGGRLAIEKIADDVPKTEAELAVFMKRLLEEPLAENKIVADDGKTLNILMVNKQIKDSAAFMKDFEEIINPLYDYFEVHYTADVAFSEHTVKYLEKDLLFLLILTIIVSLLILFFSFKALRAVLLPVITVVISAVWAVGFSVLLGYKLTVVSIIMPVIIIAIGSSYTIHIISEYYRTFNDNYSGDIVAAITKSISHVVFTVILAGLTTICGFFSLMFTSISPLREFGISVSIGILTSVILSLFFLPALLSKLTPPNRSQNDRANNGIIIKVIIGIGDIVVKKYKIISIVFILIIFLTVLIYPNISRNVDYISYFPSEDKIVADTIYVLKKTGGAQSLNIVLKAPGDQKDYFLDKTVINKMMQLQEQIKENDNVLELTSYYTLMQQINGVMTGNDQFPSGKGLIRLLSRYFKLLEEGENDVVFGSQASFVNSDYSQLTIYTKVYDSATGKAIVDEDIGRLMRQFEDSIHSSMPGIETVYFWGNTVINYDAGLQIQRDQLFSSTLSLLLIALVSFIFFRSVMVGLLSLIPLVFAIAFNYIIMVVFQIPLDITTVLVSNVAIGVGVDDAIHFLLQYRKQLKMNSSIQAVKNSLVITGRPITLTTLSIGRRSDSSLFCEF